VARRDGRDGWGGLGAGALGPGGLRRWGWGWALGLALGPGGLRRWGWGWRWGLALGPGAGRTAVGARPGSADG
jgi:hypothetical protein